MLWGRDFEIIDEPDLEAGEAPRPLDGRMGRHTLRPRSRRFSPRLVSHPGGSSSPGARESARLPLGRGPPDVRRGVAFGYRIRTRPAERILRLRRKSTPKSRLEAL
jgi:hypothetical protein